MPFLLGAIQHGAGMAEVPAAIYNPICFSQNVQASAPLPLLLCGNNEDDTFEHQAVCLGGSLRATCLSRILRE